MAARRKEEVDAVRDRQERREAIKAQETIQGL